MLALLVLAALCAFSVAHPHHSCYNCDDDYSGGGGGDRGCFPGDASVTTKAGKLRMQDLPSHPDALLEVLLSDGTLGWSPVQVWLHASGEQTDYLELTMDTGHTITLTMTHLIFRTPCEGASEKSAVFAKRVSVGDCVLVKADGLQPSKVQSIREIAKAGRYAFTTSTGNIVVNDVLASAYSIVEHDWLQHAFFQVVYRLSTVPGVKMAQECLLQIGRDALDPIADMFHHGYQSL